MEPPGVGYHDALAGVREQRSVPGLAVGLRLEVGDVLRQPVQTHDLATAVLDGKPCT